MKFLMLRLSLLLVWTSIMVMNPRLSHGQIAPQDVQSENFFAVQRIDGITTNNVQPYVELHATEKGWHVELGFVFHTDFPGLTWLEITNRVGSRLELWTTDSVKVPTANQDALRAFSLPKLTTSTEILHSVPRQGRQYQWISVGHAVYAGRVEIVAHFELADVFTVPFTNNYILDVVPLIYKIETNHITAHLIEYPQIRIGLLSNGRVEELKK